MHTHTSFCDGKNTAAEIACHSDELISLGFSSHAPLPFTCGWSMLPEQLDDYINGIASLKKNELRLQLYTGLEVDYIPNEISPSSFARDLDFTIGSIHFVERLSDGRPWEVDGSRLQFIEGLEEIFNGDIREAIVRYFELTREMVEKDPPTIVGHLDKIKIQNTANQYFNEEDKWYRDEIVRTLNVVATSPCIVEVNTRGIYQKKSETCYPSPWILSLIHQRGIPITLSSDAHQRTDLTRCFPQTAACLNQIGFETLAVLVDDKWTHTKFNRNGLILK